VRGDLMVAVPDPSGPSFPSAARGFHEVPRVWRNGPLKIISSNNDPYSSPSFTERIVASWGAEHVALGAMGHINADSGLGDWPDGWALIEPWRQRLNRSPT
jgi:predicted alpha/beta hydrolase family esterase